MKVLVACEESQRVCLAFREKGHEAYSCDILEPSGGHPEYHILGDVLSLLNGATFQTMGGKTHTVEHWDLIIAHPPCTYLTVAGNRYFSISRYGEKAIKRHHDREKAIDFFMAFVNADCDKIAVENPIGIMSTRYKKPSQIIQPYYFGDHARKATCLWLKGLPAQWLNNGGDEVNTIDIEYCDRCAIPHRTTIKCSDLSEINIIWELLAKLLPEMKKNGTLTHYSGMMNVTERG